MSQVECHENYPAKMVILSNLVALEIYGIGAFILASLFVWLLIPYLLYVLWLEARVLMRSCVNCYYYGKVCAFGKGKFCTLFFKKGNPQNFAADNVTWFQLLPDFLVSLVPVAVGIFIVSTNFSVLYLVLLIILIALSFGGNAIVRGNFACKYCKQREIGCPAEKLFSKEKAQQT